MFRKTSGPGDVRPNSNRRRRVLRVSADKTNQFPSAFIRDHAQYNPFITLSGD
jgi:hypothetical protein